MEKEENIARFVYELSEENIYHIVEKFEESQVVDKTLVYCFLKAFYLQITQLHSNHQKQTFDLDKVYHNYKENLKEYFKTNNPNMEDVLLEQVLDFFDNSFAMIQSFQNCDIEDSYEFRHYTINAFEVLKMILEKKSNTLISHDFFDGCIRKIIEHSDDIFWYLKRQK